jgi:hypothetical protein
MRNVYHDTWNEPGDGPDVAQADVPATALLMTGTNADPGGFPKGGITFEHIKRVDRAARRGGQNPFMSQELIVPKRAMVAFDLEARTDEEMEFIIQSFISLSNLPFLCWELRHCWPLQDLNRSELATNQENWTYTFEQRAHHFRHVWERVPILVTCCYPGTAASDDDWFKSFEFDAAMTRRLCKGKPLYCWCTGDRTPANIRQSLPWDVNRKFARFIRRTFDGVVVWGSRQLNMPLLNELATL